MKISECSKNTLKFAAVLQADGQYFPLLDNDKIIYAVGAPLISLISERLGMCYKVVAPPDNSYGAELPGGNWSGLMGMVKQSEADIAVSLVQTESRSRAVDFSYPYYQTALSFLADKPEPALKNMAICPFSYEVWIILMVTLCAVTFLIYTLMKRKQECQKVTLNVFAILLQQSVSFKVKTSMIKLLVLMWFLGAMIISNGYKAVLQSVLNVPTMMGIRDISDLSRAVLTNSIQCFTYKGSYLSDIFSKSEVSLRAIGKCLNLNEKCSGEPEDFFLKASHKKVFIGERAHLMHYNREYRISDDSFQDIMYAFALSEHFCCRKYLNTLILRSATAGLIQKIFDDEQFYMKYEENITLSDQSTLTSKINLLDVSSAFYILTCGWILALLTLLAESIMIKYSL